MLRTLVVIIGLGLAGIAAAKSAPDSLFATYSRSDQRFLEAREAFQSGQIARLNALAPELRDHPLAPYVSYWQIRSHIDSASEGELREFFNQYRGTLSADRLRADWLRSLGRARNWEVFFREFPALGIEDPDVTCHALIGRDGRGDAAAAQEARVLWLNAREQLPETCTGLFTTLVQRGLLSPPDVWNRIRSALDLGNLALAKAALSYLPPAEKIDPRWMDQAARHPQQFLARKPLPLARRGQRELAIFALAKTAENWPQVAAENWRRILSEFPLEERHYGWGQIGLAAARRLDPRALEWFKEAERLTDRQLYWKARIGLRAGDWRSVQEAIDAMSGTDRNSPVWRYWMARALAGSGRTQEATVQFAQLSSEFNFYGQLASEELGTSINVLPETYKPSPTELEAMTRRPGIARALALLRVNLRYEGALEWQWSLKDMNDQELLAAAEIAARNEWYERAIDTAERTTVFHDFSLRYPAPYRETVQSYTRDLGLDEAWVYGLVRQESRFVASARSVAGASGLMQLMPTTAKLLARRLGWKGHHTTLTAAVESNVGLGTNYLRQMLDSFGNQQLLAAAAYNAGPRRIRDWQMDRPMEGAIFAETIPLNETRDYVKKVMNNAAFYARLFHQPVISLRERIGTVPARRARED
jgi:soluble lytic murein transglycosylase